MKRKIYTRTGDDGTTGLIGGARVDKQDLRVIAYGEIDELGAVLGICRREAHKEMVSEIEWIQRTLFEIGSILATASNSSWKGMPEITAPDVEQLERWIDSYDQTLPELSNFILAGGSQLGATLHLARAVCRRAERSCLTLHKVEPLPETVLQFINRLSDLCFVMARAENQRAGLTDLIWRSRS